MKQQNINTRLAEIKREFRDIFTNLNTDIDPHPNKQTRYMQIKHDVSELAEWTHNEYENCLSNMSFIKKRKDVRKIVNIG